MCLREVSKQQIKNFGGLGSTPRWSKGVNVRILCACTAFLCQGGEERERQGDRVKGGRERGEQRTLFWHAMCLNVPFLSLTPLHSFPLRQFSGRQRIDLILGLSYHLAAFHSSVFIKIRRAETRERKRGREKKGELAQNS